MTKTRSIAIHSGAAARALALVFGLHVAGCSGEEPTDGNASSSNGGSGSGGSSSTEVVGFFQVQILPSDDATSGSTSVIGKLNDGPTPAIQHWEVTREDGDCRLEEPRNPFCEEGCGSDVCVDDGVCQPYPTAASAGDVTLEGVNLAGGGSQIALKPLANVYQPAAGTQIAYPPFAEGDPISIHASGEAFSPFDLSIGGVAPLALTSTNFELDVAKPFELTWEAASDPQASSIHLELDISHHGGSRGQIVCESADTGSLTISAELMSALIALGVAGFPSVIMTRSSVDLAQIEVGQVELEVSSKLERFVTVVGVDSCTANEDCADGETCQADLTCG